MCDFKMTRENAREVLGRIADMIEESQENADALLPELDTALDALLSQDFFGTEGQCDPRGDRRG